MKSKFNFKIIKNGATYDMHDLGIWVNYFNIHSPRNDLILIPVPGMDGAHLGSQRMDIRDVDVELQVETNSVKELDDKKQIIYDLFFSKEPFKIIRDFKNLEIHVMQQESYSIDDITCSDGEFPISLIMLDPYLYGPEQSSALQNTTVIENKGTAEADPI